MVEPEVNVYEWILLEMDEALKDLVAGIIDRDEYDLIIRNLEDAFNNPKL